MKLPYKVREALNLVVAIAAALVVGFLAFSYAMYLQDHGCVLGTTCISLTR